MAGEIDLIGSLGGMFNFGLIGTVLVVCVVLICIVAFLFLTGRIFNNLKSRGLNFEQRQNAIVFTDIDDCGPIREGGDLKYKFKNRKMTTVPPNLKYINRVGGKDYIFFYWPDRNEAYPFSPRMFTAEAIWESAINAYVEKNSVKDENGVITERKEPTTLVQFREGLQMVSDAELIYYRPVVDDSVISSIVAELKTNRNLYMNKLLAFIDKWGSTIVVILALLAFMFAVINIADALKNLDVNVVVQTVQGAAEGAAGQLP